MISLQTYTNRRQQLIDQMPPSSAALFFAAPEVSRNSDNSYPYRQNSDFWYLTGFNEPEALFVIIKRENNQTWCVLFNRSKDPVAEIWQGRRLGQAAAIDKLGVDEAKSWEAIAADLPALLSNLQQIYHAQGQYGFADAMVFAALAKLRQSTRTGDRAPATMVDWRPIVHEMRLFKDSEEIALIRQACEISARGHERAMRIAKPSLWEYQLEAEILQVFCQSGARYPAYNTIVGGGENGCILHYTENDKQLAAGDLVLIDAGCEYFGYAGDITRTFPVNGKFTQPQREIYQLVLQSLQLALDQLRPGATLKQVTENVGKMMLQGLVALGILQGEVENLFAEQAHRRFFMHGLGHWLGLDVHDVGDYGQPFHTRALQPGMVLTVEPGIYIQAAADIPECYHGIGIRIEDDILITAEGNENLTTSIVKDPDEIEALMAQGSQP
jgi:Xaa-Pro aminopeptidase